VNKELRNCITGRLFIKRMMKIQILQGGHSHLLSKLKYVVTSSHSEEKFESHVTSWTTTSDFISTCSMYDLREYLPVLFFLFLFSVISLIKTLIKLCCWDTDL
jgi:type III secretory pathway component EscT